MRTTAAAVLLLISQLAPISPAEGFTTRTRPTTRTAGCIFLSSPRGEYISVVGEIARTGWTRSVMSPPPAQCGRTRGRILSVRMAADGELNRPPPVQQQQQQQQQQRSKRKEAAHRVIFMRHGECEWNRDNRFLGWADIGLTEDGEMEAKRAAHTLTELDIQVDEIFCSYLKRSIKSAWVLADEMDQTWMPINTDWRLNEQMYGALQGLNKRATAERYGTELTQQWRRSYDQAPPAVPGGQGYFPVGDSKYAALTEDDIPASWCGSPNTESLKDAQARSWLFWRERLVPRIMAGKTVLICGHGNIIRSMLKRLDNIPNEVLKQLSIPRAIPLVYDLDEDLVPVSSSNSLGPLSGQFLGNPIEVGEALARESLKSQLGTFGSVSDGGGVGAGSDHPAAVSPLPKKPTEDQPTRFV